MLSAITALLFYSQVPTSNTLLSAFFMACLFSYVIDHPHTVESWWVAEFAVIWQLFGEWL